MYIVIEFVFVKVWKGESKVITRLDVYNWKTDSRANSLLTKLCWWRGESPITVTLSFKNIF